MHEVASSLALSLIKADKAASDKPQRVHCISGPYAGIVGRHQCVSHMRKGMNVYIRALVIDKHGSHYLTAIQKLPNERIYCTVEFIHVDYGVGIKIIK
jgi:hypothetical protein